MTHKRSDRFRNEMNLLSLLFILLSFVSCRHDPVGKLETETGSALTIYFFHLTARCEACDAIETNTAKVLEKYYKNLLDTGIIEFKSVNIDSRENRYVADKYKVSYTSLLLVRSDGTVTDFTNTALNYAYMNPLKFGELLKAEMDKNLK